MMSTQEIKEIKKTLGQILQNQTAMMAQLVVMNKLHDFKQLVKSPTALNWNVPPNTPSSVIKKALVAMPMVTPTTTHKRKVELPLDDISNSGGPGTKHRRGRQSTYANVGAENVPEGKKAAVADDKLKVEKMKKVQSLPNNERLCSICENGVDIGKLVEHVWDHIKKEMSEKDKNIYSYVCDAKGCTFCTNKFEEAKVHAQTAHPDLKSDKTVVDNSETTTKIFILAVAQCFDTLDKAEKDQICEMRFK